MKYKYKIEVNHGSMGFQVGTANTIIEALRIARATQLRYDTQWTSRRDKGERRPQRPVVKIYNLMWIVDWNGERTYDTIQTT